MPPDFISSQLKKYQNKCNNSRKEAAAFAQESPLLRTRRGIQQQLQENENYRASILRNVTPFIGLSEEAITIASQSMEEKYYVKGDLIIEQDDIGDSFYVLEEGIISVLRKANMRDENEEPKELVQLGKNSYFGEISLLTAEPRSATIKVISDTAKCLMMTKFRFDELLQHTNKIQAENRRLIGRDVLDSVPLFKSLSTINKKKIVDVMMPMSYRPNSYICRQGTPGNSFYIMTEGTCKVTINEGTGEREVAKLRAGDFFGEVALIEANNRRTANVISMDTVSCLTLSRADFNRLLKSLKVKIMEHQAMRSGNNQTGKGKGGATSDLQHVSSLAKKRRISGFNTHGQRDDVRINSMLRRFATFTTQALWNSLYSRMFREMLLDPTKCSDYGGLAQAIMRNHSDTRYSAVQAIQQQAIRILELDPPRRSPVEHSFIIGLLRQRNILKDELCHGWPMHQFVTLCKKIKIARFKLFRTIFDVDSRGTCAYLLLRGTVRLFSKANNSDPRSTVKTYFEQDLFPGEVFGETALSGMHSRIQTARAVTNVELAVIDDSDFMTAQDKDSMHMGTEERQRFLLSVSMFKNWDSYKLLRLAHALVQQEVNKGAVILHHGGTSRDLKFLVNGRVDLITNLEQRYVITTLLKGDYIGESGVINRYVKASGSRVTEHYYCVAVTKVDVLVLPEASFTLFDLSSVNLLRSAFLAKAEWRQQRVRQMKHERAKMRKHTRKMHREAEALKDLPEEYLRLAAPPPTTATAANNHNRNNKGKTEFAISASRSASRSRDQGEEFDRGMPAISIPQSPNAAATATIERHHQPLDRFPVSALPTVEQHEVPAIVTPKYEVRPGRPLSSTLPRTPNATGPAATTAATTAGGGAAGGSSDHNREQGIFRAKSSDAAGAGGAGAGAVATGSKTASGENTHHRWADEDGYKLEDIEDIPEMFVRDMDFFLVSSTCRTDRDRREFEKHVAQSTRPKSARLRVASAQKKSTAGFVLQYNADVKVAVTVATQLAVEREAVRKTEPNRSANNNNTTTGGGAGAGGINDAGDLGSAGLDDTSSLGGDSGSVGSLGSSSRPRPHTAGASLIAPTQYASSPKHRRKDYRTDLLPFNSANSVLNSSSGGPQRRRTIGGFGIIGSRRPSGAGLPSTGGSNFIGGNGNMWNSTSQTAVLRPMDKNFLSDSLEGAVGMVPTVSEILKQPDSPKENQVQSKPDLLHYLEPSSPQTQIAVPSPFAPAPKQPFDNCSTPAAVGNNALRDLSHTASLPPLAAKGTPAATTAGGGVGANATQQQYGGRPAGAGDGSLLAESTPREFQQLDSSLSSVGTDSRSLAHSPRSAPQEHMPPLGVGIGVATIPGGESSSLAGVHIPADVTHQQQHPHPHALHLSPRAAAATAGGGVSPRNANNNTFSPRSAHGISPRTGSAVSPRFAFSPRAGAGGTTTAPILETEVTDGSTAGTGASAGADGSGEGVTTARRRSSFSTSGPAPMLSRKSSSVALMGSMRIPLGTSYQQMLHEAAQEGETPESHIEMKLNKAIEKYLPGGGGLT